MYSIVVERRVESGERREERGEWRVMGMGGME